jgi:hypothetical protein
MKHVVTVLVEEEDGTVSKATREFGGFSWNVYIVLDKHKHMVY